jgi:hypothetical protein
MGLAPEERQLVLLQRTHAARHAREDRDQPTLCRLRSVRLALDSLLCVRAQLAQLLLQRRPLEPLRIEALSLERLAELRHGCVLAAPGELEGAF